jgi:hypothetical protein
MMNAWRCGACLLALVGLLAGYPCTTASAPFIVVSPPHAGSTVAGYEDDAPLGFSQQHFQQIIAPSLIPGISAGDSITALGFRVVTGGTAVPAQVVPNYQIWLSQSANIPGEMSATFASNRGTDFTLVRGGSLAITENMFPGGVGLNAFGMISFATPYVYKGGSLLIEISYDAFPAGGSMADSEVPFDEDVARTGFVDGSSGTIADRLYGEAIVMAFEVVPVPEPSTGFFLAGGLFLLLLAAWRRR